MAGFALALVAEGATILNLKRQVAQLSEKATAPDSTVPALERPRPAGAVAQPSNGAAANLRALPSLPVFTNTAGPGPGAVFETLGSAEGRVRLGEILGAMKEQRQQEKFVKSSERRDRVNQRLHDIVGSALGLNPQEARKAQDLLVKQSQARRHAIEEMQSGVKSRAEAKRDLDAADRSVETSMQELLGDQRMTALKELRKREDRAIRPGGAPAPGAAAPNVAPAAGAMPLPAGAAPGSPPAP